MTTLPLVTSQKLKKIKDQKSPMSCFMWKDRKDNFHSPYYIKTIFEMREHFYNVFKNKTIGE